MRGISCEEVKFFLLYNKKLACMYLDSVPVNTVVFHICLSHCVLTKKKYVYYKCTKVRLGLLVRDWAILRDWPTVYSFYIFAHRIVFWRKKIGKLPMDKKKCDTYKCHLLSPFRPFSIKLGYIWIQALHTVSIFAHRIVFWQKNRETTAGQKKV